MGNFYQKFQENSNISSPTLSSRQADDSPSPHVDKRRHLANSPPPSTVYVVYVWPLSLIKKIVHKGKGIFKNLFTWFTWLINDLLTKIYCE